MASIRLDQLLVQRGLVESRSRAQALIKAGKVLAGGTIASKASETFSEDTELQVTGMDHPWVSRGGMKLAHAMEVFGIDPPSQVIADIGASTGGFTDVLLQAGAARVYAVDVGRDQLHAKLRGDGRVANLEGMNARYLGADHIPQPLDAVVCDASFISLKLVLPPALSMVKNGGWLVALIKPQFEAGKERVGKNGVVRDPAIHAEIRDDIQQWLESLGWSVKGICDSPIEGPQGNREFLLHAVKIFA